MGSSAGCRARRRPRRRLRCNVPLTTQATRWPCRRVCPPAPALPSWTTRFSRETYRQLFAQAYCDPGLRPAPASPHLRGEDETSHADRTVLVTQPPPESRANCNAEHLFSAPACRERAAVTFTSHPPILYNALPDKTGRSVGGVLLRGTTGD
ncbi:MAG: hypothetical protein BJ554DRAFT_3644 [Olpidium bornovanus]|uniref:Uncharacterized protein n=1 Tax=Olpidium bornovanus TaxID=278681 RepID=A0A8H7ZNV6_9FUNG|nr:MAG: hypothetical protein BJ554DRAFT_3644 [Olpidium bornovanus]